MRHALSPTESAQRRVSQQHPPVTIARRLRVGAAIQLALALLPTDPAARLAMTGLMQRILRRRSDPDEQADEQPTHAFEQLTTPLPAGLPDQETAPPPSAPSFRDRGRLRRRLRYLRRARELGFRDLGGLVFDLRRFDRDRPDLVQAKLDALSAVDRELRALEVALDQRRPIHELREPGIASCPRCGALHPTDARFCPACGTALRGSRAEGGEGDGGGQHPIGKSDAPQAAGANGAEGDRSGSPPEERPVERWPGGSW